MPINKVVASFDEAVKDIFDGAVILLGGFGSPGGKPGYLFDALVRHGAKNLTVVCNSTYYATDLFSNKQIKKTIASVPLTAARGASGAIVSPFEEQFRKGEMELEMVPQGTLAERIRANKAGIGAFYTPTGPKTVIEQGKEVRIIDGRPHLLEYPIKADFAFIRAYKADRLGNLIFRGTSRSFNATMAGAARVTIVEVDEVIPVEEMDPEAVVIPALYVERIVIRPEDGRTKIVQKIRREER